MLAIRDLHSYYGEAHVLHGASLTVPDGEVVALLGRNGMGKTTLIRSVMRLKQPRVRQGSIRWRDEELIGLTPHEVARRSIALVPQGRRLFPSLTVLEHLTMHKSARDTSGWTIDRLFGLFPRLAERKGHRGGQLSGGERQMLALGRALMARPRLLLLDEPSMGLAPRLVAEIFATIRSLKDASTTILLVDQNARAALSVADRAYVLEVGRIALSGRGTELLDDPAVQQAYLGL